VVNREGRYKRPPLGCHLPIKRIRRADKLFRFDGDVALIAASTPFDVLELLVSQALMLKRLGFGLLLNCFELHNSKILMMMKSILRAASAPAGIQLARLRMADLPTKPMVSTYIYRGASN
jgi:hypothetical protein